MDKFWLKSYQPGVPAEIDWTQYRSLTHLLEEAFRKYADRKAYVCMDKAITYAELDRMSQQMGAWLQVERPEAGRAGGDHDAQRAAVSGGDGGRAARRLHHRQRQSAVHAARAAAPADRLGRRSDHRAGEFRHHARAGDRQDPGQARRRRQHGRHARRLEGHDRQPGGAQGEEAGAGVFAAGRDPVQPHDGGRRAHDAHAGHASGTTTSPSCSTPAAPPACRRAPCCCTGT